MIIIVVSQNMIVIMANYDHNACDGCHGLYAHRSKAIKVCITIDNLWYNYCMHGPLKYQVVAVLMPLGMFCSLK